MAEKVSIVGPSKQFRLYGRFLWPGLITPKVFKDGTPKFECTLIITEDTDVSALQNAVKEIQAFPEVASKGAAWLEELKKPLSRQTDEETLEKRPFLRDKKFLKGKLAVRPDVRDNKGKPMSAEDITTIKSGDFGYLILTLNLNVATKAYFYQLLGVQKMKDGDPLHSVPKADNDMFETFTDDEIVNDPTIGMDL